MPTAGNYAFVVAPPPNNNIIIMIYLFKHCIVGTVLDLRPSLSLDSKSGGECGGSQCHGEGVHAPRRCGLIVLACAVCGPLLLVQPYCYDVIDRTQKGCSGEGSADGGQQDKIVKI